MTMMATNDINEMIIAEETSYSSYMAVAFIILIAICTYYQNDN